MLTLSIMAAYAMIGIAMTLNIWRLARGPSMPDRILALDTLTINAIALVILAGIDLATGAYLEVALLMAMMGFVGTVALCKFILGGDVIE
jgi:multicomponent K+:H+ antiporter subunit F